MLAAHAKARSEVVPGPTPEPVEPNQLRLVFDGEATELEPSIKPDVMTCPKCEGRMALKMANTPEDIARVLAEVGLGPRPPPRPRPPPPGQLEFDFAA